MTKKSDAPAIRFKGFSDAWEQRKFEEIAVRSSVICSDDTLPRVEYEDIVSGTGRLNKDIYAKQSSKSGIVFHQGDVLYGKLRPYLQNWLLPTFDGLAVGDFWVLQPQNADSSFLYRLIQSRQFDEVANQSTGTKMPRADWKLVSKTVFSIPSNISEQAAIGTYFTALDSLITLHQRKFEKLTNVKKSMLEKMFPQNGSSYPEIRFKGFTDPWEQRKLSEITDKVTEKNAGLQYVETFTNSAEFGIISQRDFFDHDIAKLGSLDGYYIVKTEDFVYNPRISTSAPVGPINRNKLGRTGVMSPLYTVFRPHDIDTTYLEYFFKCGYWHSFMNFNGDSGARSDRFSIRDNVFFQMPIPIPDIDEQRKIGELLTCLDNLITLHQRKCALLFSPFQAFISMMFTTSTFSWEQRKLGDMMNVTSVKRIHQSDWTDSGVRFLRARDIVAAAKNEEPDDYLYISKEKYEEYSTLSGKVGVSDLLVTGVGTIRVPYLVRNLEPLYFKDGNIIWFQNSDKIDGKFLFYSFSAEQIQGFINESAGIGTVGTYTIESGKKTPISLPDQIEQAKVGEFFQQLDNLITLHQRKCIFFTGRAGRLISTVNKKRITSSWEQREVGDLLIERSQQAPMSDEYPLMAFIANEGVAPKGERYDRSALVTDTVNKLYKKTEKGDFIYSSNNLETGSIGLNKYGKACISPVYSIFEPTGIADSDFLGRRLVRKDFINAMVKWRQGVIYGQWGIHESDFLKIEISVPSVEEQRKIGAYLDQLDNLITLHQRKPFLMKWRTSDANRNQTNRLVL